MSNARNLANLLGTGTTIASAKIADDAITNAKILNDAVTGAKIEDNPTIAGNLTIAGTTTATGTITAQGETAGFVSFDKVQLNATDGSATDAGDNLVLNSTDGSSDDGDGILFENFTNDGSTVLETSQRVLQVVRNYQPNSGYINTTSQSFVGSGITASITPKQAGNILIVDFQVSLADAEADTLHTKMFQSTAGGAFAVMDNAGLYHSGIQVSSTNRYTPLTFGGKFVTTSTEEITFQPFFASVSGGSVRIVHSGSSYALTVREISR